MQHKFSPETILGPASTESVESVKNVDLFAFTTGPRTAKIIIIGEAWGQYEAIKRQPFVGSAGMELNKMLKEAGLERERVLCANIVDSQPPGNEFTHFVFHNDEVKARGKAKNPIEDYHGIFPKPQLSAGIRKIWRLIETVNPDLIIACGNWPLHILSPHATVSTKRGFKLPAGIANWRGSQTYSRPSPETAKQYPLLPIIHPAAILREWKWRTITVHDLRSRAKRYTSGALNWSPPNDHFISEPSFETVETLLNTWIARACHSKFMLCADVETENPFTSVIGLADESISLCIPFYHYNAEGKSVAYFTLEQETFIFERLKQLLEHPNVEIVGQNFIYDSQYFFRYYGIDAIVRWDTMVMHHLIFPGTPKALHNLAALYCHYYCYWKDESQGWRASALGASVMWLYNCKDTRATYEAATRLKLLLSATKNMERYDTRMRSWKLARKMTLRGCNVDKFLRKQMSLQVWTQIQELSQFLLAAVPEDLQYTKSGKPWFSWSGSIMHLLYNVLGLKKMISKDTGNPTADDNAINMLLEDPKNEWLEPLLGRLSALRSASVFKSHFLDTKLDPCGRLVTQFNIAQPETFRWSSRDNAFSEGGNNQNVPKVED